MPTFYVDRHAPISETEHFRRSPENGQRYWEWNKFSYIVYPSGIFNPDVEYVAILSTN